MLDINQAKRNAAISAGYNFLTIIFTNDGNQIYNIF